MRKINVFGMIIAVIYKPLEHLGYTGIFEPIENRITIDENLSGDESIQTEIHEVLHACWFRLSLDQARIPAALQEVIVDTFATALVENYKIRPK